jgi:hypothetical protein
VFWNEMRLLWRDPMAVVAAGAAGVHHDHHGRPLRSGGGPRLRCPSSTRTRAGRERVVAAARAPEIVSMSRGEAESLVRDRNRAAAATVFPWPQQALSAGRTSDIELLTILRRRSICSGSS